MSANGEIDETVRLFYAASVGEIAWEAALDPMLAATGFDGAALTAMDRPSVSFVTDQINQGLWHRLNPELKSEYSQHYYKIDPRFRHYANNPGIRITHDYLHTAESEIDRDPYYAWYLKAQPTRYYVGGRTNPSLPIVVSLTLHRRSHRGAARQDEIDRFSLLFDHLERALLIEYRLYRSGVSAASDHVENNPTGIALLDKRGRVVHANAALRQMAAWGDALVMSSDGLRAIFADDDRSLQTAVGVALASNSAAKPPAPIRITRSTGQRAYLAIVMAVTSHEGLFREWAPAASILVIDPTRGKEPSLELLRRLFRLTPAEAQLAAILLVEGSIDEAGKTLGVSLTTIRSHLAALFRKTGTSRQGELIRLLATVPWDLLR